MVRSTEETGILEVIVNLAVSRLRRVLSKIGPLRTIRDLMLKTRPALFDPPPSYTRPRADFVFGEAFRRCVEYICFTSIQGDFLEFGTLHGYTARWLASLMNEFSIQGHLWLYDSFEGLPEINTKADEESYEVAINKVWFPHAMKVEAGIDQQVFKSLSPLVGPDRLHVIKGYFDATMPTNITTSPAALVHIDCDLYSSTKYVLDTLIEKKLFQDGTVLLFDDFNCNRASPRMGERLALKEAFENQDRYTYSPWFSYGWHAQTFFVHELSSAPGK